jgi:hypothetical protein
MIAVIFFAMVPIAGCQITVRNMSVWIYPAVTFPSRSVEVGGGSQVVVPEYNPKGDSICVGVRLVHINAENKTQMSTSSLLKWPAIISRQMANK